MAKHLRFLKSAVSWIKSHKVASIVIALVLGGLYFYTRSGAVAATRYVLAQASRGTIISTVTGTGQVGTLDQIDVKPKASGDLVYLGVVAGQTVKKGALIARLDTTDAEKAVRDAEVNLETAKLSLDKLMQPADELSLIQSENSLTSAKESKAKSEADLAKAYEDAFTAVSNAFIDLPGVITGVQDVLYKTTASNQAYINYYADLVRGYDIRTDLYKQNTDDAYTAARTAYDKSFSDYKTASRSSDNAAIESLLAETYEMTKLLADSVKSTDNFLSFVKDRLTEQTKPVPSTISTQQTNTASYTSKANSNLSSLLSAKNSIKNTKDSIVSAGRTIEERTASLAKLKEGPDALDLRSAQITVTQRENTLKDAKDSLADYYVRAPFDGIISKVNVRKTDSVSSGTAIATLITKQKVATVSLNEIDAAKVKTGQKVTLTFDAVDGLSIAGEVAELDTIGTVSQGVVTYNVKISFDSQDDRVKSGMSVSAAIITNVKQDVLTIPGSAVKTSGGAQYVEVPSEKISNIGGSQGVELNTALKSQPVTTGVSDDTMVEILSGLNEGGVVVVRTISAAAKTTAASAPSLFGAAGGRTGGATFRGTTGR